MDAAQQQQEARHFWNGEAATFDHEPDHGLHDPHVRAAWTRLLVDACPAPPATVLDIGCGTGSLSLLLASLHYTVTGIDFAESMLRRATEKAMAAGYTIPFQVMDASHPAFTPNQFDMLIGRHILWAVPEPAGALQRWCNLLTATGCLIVIEGCWHTGVGLTADQIVAMLPPTCTTVSVQDLSAQSDLWGRKVTDNRYMIRATRAGAAP